MPASTTNHNDRYDSDATVPYTPSHLPALPSCYLHESTNPSGHATYAYSAPTHTHSIHNHQHLPRNAPSPAYIHITTPPIAQTNAVPHHTNDEWPEKSFVHPATDFPFQPEGSGVDYVERFVDYNIPIEMFYGREYRQKHRGGQAGNGNKGVRWNRLSAEMGRGDGNDDVYVSRTHCGRMQQNGGTVDISKVGNKDLSSRDSGHAAAGRMELDELGPEADAMKRKAEALLDSDMGRTMVGDPTKKIKASKGKKKRGNAKEKDAVLGGRPSGLFGDGEDEDEVDEQELYNRCMATFAE